MKLMVMWVSLCLAAALLAGSAAAYEKVEPGVTFGHVKAKLDRDHPHLRYAYPLSPPFTSVVANALLDGLTNMSNRHGSMAEWINTMEVVMPYGEVAVVGGGAVSPFWYGRVPLPDIAGLFISWQGTTGIITKMSLQLYPKYAHRKRWFVLAYDVDAFFTMVRRGSIIGPEYYFEVTSRTSLT